MKDFVLTKPYSTIDEMLNSEEVTIFKEELKNGNFENYAIVSRTGKRYDLKGNKIDSFAKNPFFETQEEEKTIIEKNQTEEQKEMKYLDIESLIDKEVAKAVEETRIMYEKEIENLKLQHANELISIKDKVKAEILSKING